MKLVVGSLCFTLFLIPFLNGQRAGLAKFSKFNVIKVLGEESVTIATRTQPDVEISNRNRFVRECASLIEAWDDEEMPVGGSSTAFTFHVSPQHAERVKSSLRRNAIPFKIISQDMSLMIRQQISGSELHEERHLRLEGNILMTSVIPSSSADFFSSYHSQQDIHAYLLKLNASYPRADLKVIGKTYEGRDIMAMEIKSLNSADRHVTDALMLECGIHAREWISPASCLWIIDQLLNHVVDNIVSSFRGSFIIIPVMNPDGYAYTWSEDRLWRKNRSLNRFFQRCHGIDLNRNFGVAFKAGSEIFDSCQHTYAGTTAFSELETQALLNYTQSLLKRKINIKSYISVHSFSQLFMFPYGYTKNECADNKELNKISKQVVEAMGRPNGTVYRFGRIIKTVYGKATHGNSVDYMYDKVGVKYSFAVELRDQGDEGFLLHPRFIKPTANELWLAVKTILSFL